MATSSEKKKSILKRAAAWYKRGAKSSAARKKRERASSQGRGRRSPADRHRAMKERRARKTLAANDPKYNATDQKADDKVNKHLSNFRGDTLAGQPPSEPTAKKKAQIKTAQDAHPDLYNYKTGKSRVTGKPYPKPYVGRRQAQNDLGIAGQSPSEPTAKKKAQIKAAQDAHPDFHNYKTGESRVTGKPYPNPRIGQREALPGPGIAGPSPGKGTAKMEAEIKAAQEQLAAIFAREKKGEESPHSRIKSRTRRR